MRGICAASSYTLNFSSFMVDDFSVSYLSSKSCIINYALVNKTTKFMNIRSFYVSVYLQFFYKFN